MKVISSLARVLQKIVGIGFFFIWFEIGFFNFVTNKANCDWLTLILNMAHFSQNKTINTLIVSPLRSQQVQVELLEDCINISYGILDNIFQILYTENVPVTVCTSAWQLYQKKKMKVILTTLSKKTHNFMKKKKKKYLKKLPNNLEKLHPDF